MIEFNRKYDVINMMISMHSVLHERYKFRVLIINVILILSSFVLCMTAFVDIDFLQKYINISKIQLQLFRGICSIIVFTISIIMLKVKWKEKSEAHLSAKVKLFNLISKCRDIWSMEENEEKKHRISEFNNEYIIINQNITQIPDREFLSLKARHYRKKSFSKFIDFNKDVPYLVLRYRFFFNSLKKKQNGTNKVKN